MHTEDSSSALLYRWHQLINQAAQHARVEIEEELRHYLLLTVVKYLQNDELVMEARQLPLQLQALNDATHWQNLRKTADHCLVMAGLFPDMILHKPARINDYIVQGQHCFNILGQTLSGSDAALFRHLSAHFVSLIEIMHSLRYFSGSDALSPLSAFEFWSDTGCQSAYRQITFQHQALPLQENMSSHLVH